MAAHLVKVSAHFLEMGAHLVNLSEHLARVGAPFFILSRCTSEGGLLNCHLDNAIYALEI